MTLEEFSLVLSELRKKLLYIVFIFATTVILSFSMMGRIITKIQYDMFLNLNLADTRATEQLIELSQRISTISNQMAEYDSDLARNLTSVSSELLNISSSFNPYNPSIVYLAPMEVLMLKFKMSLLLGAIFLVPLILYYAIKALKIRMGSELDINTPIVFSSIAISIILFSVGAAYSYYFMLPFFLKFLYQDAISMGVNATFSVYSFVYFVISTTAIIGLTFELPLVLTLIVHLGFTTRQALVNYRRHAYIILLIVAAVITPDPTFVSQIMVTVPFILLYEFSLLIMRITGK